MKCGESVSSAVCLLCFTQRAALGMLPAVTLRCLATWGLCAFWSRWLAGCAKEASALMCGVHEAAAGDCCVLLLCGVLESSTKPVTMLCSKGPGSAVSPGDSREMADHLGLTFC